MEKYTNWPGGSVCHAAHGKPLQHSGQFQSMSQRDGCDERVFSKLNSKEGGIVSVEDVE